MIIALSSTGKTLDSALDPRFGRAAFFLIVNSDQPETVTVIDNAHATDGHGAGLKAAEAILKAGARVLITGACGPKAFRLLQQAKVRLYTATDMTAQKALAHFENGSLPDITSP